MQKNYLKAQIFTLQTLVACIIGQSIVSFSTWLVYIYLHLKSELTSYNFSFYCFSFYCNVRSCIHLSPDERFLSTMFISWSVMHSFQHQIPVYTCRKSVFFSFFFLFFFFFSYFFFFFPCLQSRFVGYLEQVFTHLNGRLPPAVSYRIKSIKIDGISSKFS